MNLTALFYIYTNVHKRLHLNVNCTLLRTFLSLGQKDENKEPVMEVKCVELLQLKIISVLIFENMKYKRNILFRINNSVKILSESNKDNHSSLLSLPEFDS